MPKEQRDYRLCKCDRTTPFSQTIFSDRLINGIVTERNTYAHTKLVNKELCNLLNMKINRKEFFAFLAVILNIGTPVANIQEYWSKQDNR